MDRNIVRHPAIDIGSPSMVPVSKATLGRIMNFIGEPIDECGPVKCVKLCPIHAGLPPFVDAAHEHERKSWRAWAGHWQKIRGKQRGNDGVGNTEVINVFLSWAARCYSQGTSTEGGFNQCPQFNPFLIQVY
jgi:hypothetical protein